MGTDIHFVVQRKDSGGNWADVSSDINDYANWDYKKEYYPKIEGEFHWVGERIYYLFAWLANVRNGYGFAGVKTHEPVTPLTDNRGLPPDFNEKEYDVGEHSMGWATFAEILAHPRPPVQMSGIVDIEHYKETVLAGKEPESWSGGIWGEGIVIIDSADFGQVNNATHVRCSWQCQSDGLDQFISAVQELSNKYGAENCRIIFGFDS